MRAQNQTIRLIGVALASLIIGVAIGFYVPKPAPSKPTISLSSTSVTAGAQYTVKFTGFPANTEIYGWVVNENPPRTFEVGVTDNEGGLEVTVNAPQTAGTWLLCTSDKNRASWATAVLTVT